MRLLGIIALLMTGVSFVLWLISWVMFNIFITALYNSWLRYAAQACIFLHMLTEFIVIGMLSIGLILIAKNLPAKDAGAK